ncbi:MAG: hypothetical protein U0R50_01785 [Gaiellales bacterium]
MIAGLSVVALCAVAVMPELSDSGDSSSNAVHATAALTPLPAGPPKGSDAHATVGRATLDDMISSAPIVFIGRALDVGGSEVVSPAGATESVPLTVHRTRFEIIRTLRGDVPLVLDITQFDVEESFPFEIGKPYVIFAEPRELGSKGVSALVPYGYYQGIYVQQNDNTVSNDLNGSIEITKLEARLKTQPKG